MQILCASAVLPPFGDGHAQGDLRSIARHIRLETILGQRPHQVHQRFLDGVFKIGMAASHYAAAGAPDRGGNGVEKPSNLVRVVFQRLFGERGQGPMPLHVRWRTIAIRIGEEQAVLGEGHQ